MIIMSRFIGAAVYSFLCGHWHILLSYALLYYYIAITYMILYTPHWNSLKYS